MSHYMSFRHRGFRSCGTEGCTQPPGRGEHCKAHTPPPTSKRCPRCKESLPFSAFGRDSRTKSGLRCLCRSCNLEADKVPCPECGKPKARRSKRCGGCSWTRKGAESARWTGGRTYRGDGYVLKYAPDHPGRTRKGYVLEHRLVMEAALGRQLLPGENVHHINGVKDDNRIENLELWITKQPKGQRVDDVVAWAREILDRYGVTA